MESAEVAINLPEAKTTTTETGLAGNIGSTEIPENFVPLYISIHKNSLSFIEENGFRIKDNQREIVASDFEHFFSQTGKEMGIGIDRTSCVFAYPRTPDKLREPLGFRKNQNILVEVQVNPENCLVANGNFVTKAGHVMTLNNTDAEKTKMVRALAKSYWEEAKSLSQYLSEQHAGESNDYEDFDFPEVLIPTDIPTNRIKILENYKYTD